MAPEPSAAVASPTSRILALPALLRAGVIDPARRRVRQVEELRVVQGHVLQALDDAKPPAVANLLMVTSARPGEGKTFTAANLAWGIAKAGVRRVVLVDADRDRRSLTGRLGLDGVPGLLDLVDNPKVLLGDVLLETVLPTLRVLPAGKADLGGDRLGSGPLLGMLELLGRAYPDALVILDTAPCLASSDAAALARLVSQVLMVVQAQGTQRSEVEASLDLVESCATIGLVLNRMPSSGEGFGAYAYAYAG